MVITKMFRPLRGIQLYYQYFVGDAAKWLVQTDGVSKGWGSIPSGSQDCIEMLGKHLISKQTMM